MHNSETLGTGAVLFDIDGTLVDSNYLHVEAWSRAFAEVGATVDDWRIHRAIGMDSSRLLEALLGADDAATAEAASDLHSSHYAALEDRLRPFDGARSLLRTLADRGVTVVLATSAPEDELAALRSVLEVEDSVAAVTSSADVETAKPEPDLIETALEKCGALPELSFLIGDTVWDVEAARRANTRTIGVLSGGVSAAELRDAGAVAVYDDVARLLEQLDASPLAALFD